jgi:superfamily I DNA/RNA helicase
MTDEQLTYVQHPLNQKSYLKACPGSGKTEAVALRAAYAFRAQTWSHKGMALLSFTNHAADVIKERVRATSNSLYPHYVGTFNSWLHGYILNPFGWRITGYEGKNNDRSIRIVEATSEAAFLHGFKTKYAYAQTGNVRAHQYYFDAKQVIFDSDNDGADAARNNLKLTDWQVKDLTDTKCRFWRAGFLNHQDVEAICYIVLHDLPSVCTLIAKRFPFIIIDECQDLSPNQLQLLTELRQAGTSIHLVGDLNQSIFSFRGSDPVVLQKFILEEKMVSLKFTENFRSIQPVVDVCGKLIKDDTIKGRPTVATEPACVYFEFTDKGELPKLASRFEEWLQRRGIDSSRCAIIARGKSTLEKLRGLHTALPRTQIHKIAAAMRDWQKKDIANRNTALSLFGAAAASICFSKEATDANCYHRPHTIESNIEWRLFLAAALENFVAQPNLVDFNQTWSQWATTVRKLAPGCFCSAWRSTNVLELELGRMRAPQGEASEQVAVALGLTNGPATQLQFSNIHQVKGRTFDAVLLVSSPTKAGDGGHWTLWLDQTAAHDEHRRFAYVASSRPRKILAWAVPALLETEREQLSQLGFAPA